MLCNCQQKYLEALEKRDEEAASYFKDGVTPVSARPSLSPTCQQLCEKGKKLAAFHLRVEAEVEHHLHGKEVEPQHFQLLCQRAAVLLSFTSK